ncbi:hypothetical protein BSKO_09007 [Bryopsis sp. KO-2023]|nr:hypothetical protein BSKO_09007 [Bryopsis sp. KO-2023]
MTSLMEITPRVGEHQYSNRSDPSSRYDEKMLSGRYDEKVSSNRYEENHGGKHMTVSAVSPGRSSESQSSVSAAMEINNSNRLIEALYDNIFRAHEEGRRTMLLENLGRYENEVSKIRDHLGMLRVEGRDHLLRDILDNLEVWESPEFQEIDDAWAGTPGISERFRQCKKHWNKVTRVIRPQNELALANVIRQHTGDRELSRELSRDVSKSMRGRSLAMDEDILRSAYSGGLPAQHQHQHQQQTPGIVNLNIAGAGAQARANQKSSQELEQDLKLAQTMEVANSQEQRFRTLLQDLNSASVDLACQMNSAQTAQQGLENLAENTNRILTHLESQNHAAQNIVNEVKADRGLSRALLTACAALLVCVGIPRLRVLLPFLRQVPLVKSCARNIERTIRTGDRNILAENLVRERNNYRTAYELLKELAEMRDDGNMFHKIAFSFLGLGKNLEKRIVSMCPPSDALCDTERWVDRRRGPYGPPAWEKIDVADPS